MKDFIKGIIGQELINRFWHLPQALLANIVYGFPSAGLKIIGVTGTDGKTTTVNMIYRILKAAGKKVSMMSTIDSPGLHVTSPDPFAIQRFVQFAKKNRDEYLVLEVTSHALDQYRFWGIKFDIAVLTNITHEHLDYHKTFENYQAVKMNFVLSASNAVVNQNIRGIKKKVITFGLTKGDFNNKEVKLNMKVPGQYNIENALASLAAAFILKINKTIAIRVLENFDGIAGRMEEIKNNKGIKIYIDFAHTPNGLEQALTALQSKTGKIFALIGAEGKRDTAKRAMLGETAKKLADIVIATAVDPRGELALINKQIAEGAKKEGAKEGVNFFIIEDRKKAIEFAILNAKKGDTVAIFGKGHEASMNLDGKKELFWSDRKAVDEVLNGQQD